MASENFLADSELEHFLARKKNSLRRVRESSVKYAPCMHLCNDINFTHTNNHNCSIIIARFRTFRLNDHGQTNRPTNRRFEGPTDRRTDKDSFRVACLQLKRFILRPRECLAWLEVNLVRNSFFRCCVFSIIFFFILCIWRHEWRSP